MSDEDAFQAALDANPDDHVTRLVFADWLQEHGDERAEGYRAMGVTRRKPAIYKTRPEIWSWHAHLLETLDSCLGRRWWDTLGTKSDSGLSNTKSFRSRRHAEDAAARAFARLPASCRAELLSSSLTVPA